MIKAECAQQVIAIIQPPIKRDTNAGVGIGQRLALTDLFGCSPEVLMTECGITPHDRIAAVRSAMVERTQHRRYPLLRSGLVGSSVKKSECTHVSSSGNGR